jgi:protocatechuate 3,4-dioxygenase beta subunit
MTQFPRELPGADQPLRIALEPPGNAIVMVERPDGRPAAGMRVYPWQYRARFNSIPMDVAELIAATTGPEGRAVFDAVAQGEMFYIEARSPEFGIQGRFHNPNGADPAVLALRAVSTVKGRLTAKDPKDLKGWKVRGWTNIGYTNFVAPLVDGAATGTVDDEGRFTLGPIAVGSLILQLDPPDGLPVVADVPAEIAVVEGKEASAEIRLLRPTAVAGRIVERGTGKPVPGFKVTLIDRSGRKHRSEDATTDADGRYALTSLPGRIMVVYSRPPRTHALIPSQTDTMPEFDVPAGVERFELPPREVRAAAAPVRGVVRDEAGRAVAGAAIEADYTFPFEKTTYGGAKASATTDEAGNFVLDGLPPDAKLLITARRLDRKNSVPVEVVADANAPRLVEVKVEARPVYAASGRVLDSDGRPVPNALVRLQSRGQGPHPQFARQVSLVGNAEIRTGPDGVFRTPGELEGRPAEYYAEVSADGFPAARTDWMPAPQGDLLRFDDLALRRKSPRAVEGRVVDREGKPVGGAAVSHADAPGGMPARTDAEGRFRLHGVAEGEALVFVEAGGFRFGGAVVGDAPGALEILLVREGEAPAAALKSLPPAMPRAEERALARDLVEPLVAQVRGGGMAGNGLAVYRALARIEPSRVLDMIENRVIPGSTPALIQAVLGQYEDDPAAAIATIGEDRDPASRAACWLALEAFRPAPNRARRGEFLDRALADARLASNGRGMPNLFREIAGRRANLGDEEKARAILAEEKQQAEASSRRRRTDGSTASAIEFHGESPESGGKLEEQRRLAFEAARRLARSDPPKARQTLRAIDGPGRHMQNRPALAPFGLGMLADELAESDPAAARGLLDEAFAGLRKVASEGRDQAGPDSAANLMAELLPVVERLDPGRLVERAWLAASARKPWSIFNPTPRDVEGVLALAMCLSRYDRAVASAVAGPILEILPEYLAWSNVDTYSGLPTIVKTLVAYDPNAAASVFRALPASAREARKSNPDPKIFSAESSIRLAIVEALAVPPGPGRAQEAGRTGTLAPPYRLDR